MRISLFPAIFVHPSTAIFENWHDLDKSIRLMFICYMFYMSSQRSWTEDSNTNNFSSMERIRGPSER